MSKVSMIGSRGNGKGGPVHIGDSVNRIADQMQQAAVRAPIASYSQQGRGRTVLTNYNSAEVPFYRSKVNGQPWTFPFVPSDVPIAFGNTYNDLGPDGTQFNFNEEHPTTAIYFGTIMDCCDEMIEYVKDHTACGELDGFDYDYMLNRIFAHELSHQLGADRDVHHQGYQMGDCHDSDCRCVMNVIALDEVVAMVNGGSACELIDGFVKNNLFSLCMAHYHNPVPYGSLVARYVDAF